MSLSLGLFLIVTGASRVLCDTCDDCVGTYSQAKSGVTPPEKCTALKNYLTCLETAIVSDSGCSITVSQSSQIEIDFNEISSNCVLGPVCECQINFWSAGPTASCSASKSRLTCMRGKAGACDDQSSVADLAATTESIISADASCVIGDNTGCQCELGYVRADVSDVNKLCTETKLFINCLKDIDGTTCDGATSVSAATAVAESLATSLPDCDISGSPCKCDADYAAADVGTDVERCSALLIYMDCLVGKTGVGCDGTSSLRSLALNVKTSIDGMTCSITSACQCQIDFNMANTMDLCSKLTQLISCLGSVTATTEAGCNSVDLKEHLLQRYNTLLLGLACSSGMKAQMTPLLILGLIPLINLS